MLKNLRISLRLLKLVNWIPIPILYFEQVSTQLKIQKLQEYRAKSLSFTSVLP